jgi:hypothetical protein
MNRKIMNKDIINIVEKIKPYITEMQTAFPFIYVMYIFGSYAKGTATKKSDLDLAIFIDNNAYDFMVDLNFSVFWEDRLHLPIETLVMQKVSPIVQHEVLRTGVRVFEKDSEKRSILELQSFKLFLDAKYYQKLRSKYRR